MALQSSQTMQGQRPSKDTKSCVDWPKLLSLGPYSSETGRKFLCVKKMSSIDYVGRSVPSSLILAGMLCVRPKPVSKHGKMRESRAV